MSDRFNRVYYDVETNGFLADLDTIHCLVIQCLDTGDVLSCADHKPYASIEQGIMVLEEAAMRVGHNSIGFDEPAIKKVYPWYNPKGRAEDSLISAKTRIDKDSLRKRDFPKVARGFPAQLIGRYSLAAFGERLRLADGIAGKSDYDGGWETWSQSMQQYCEQDVATGVRVWTQLNGKAFPAPDKALELEYDVARIVSRQTRHGIYFDQPKAHALHAVLIARRAAVEDELATVFKPMYLRDGGLKVSSVSPKKDYRRRTADKSSWIGYTQYAPFTKVKRTSFNPGSRVHIEHWLRSVHGWKPTQFGNDGHATVDDVVLANLPWAEAKLLGEYLMLNKRLGQLSSGQQAWLGHVTADSIIRAGVNTLGAATARMTHSRPNLAQVPGIVDKKTGGPMPYGRQSRELFTARPGYTLVGCDADALELRCLAGYMAKYDRGAYIKTILEGNKSKGTDMHTINQKALGLTSRDAAKTWFYAFLYGAGGIKLGTVAGIKSGTAAQSRGNADKTKFLKSLPALGKLVRKTQKAVDVGYIEAIDGRRVPLRSKHAALNTLLQSAGALIMKVALVILDDKLQQAELTHSEQDTDYDYEFVLNVHDEFQIETKPEHAEAVGEAAAQAIVEAGEYLDLGCPLAAHFSVGPTWADTH